MRKAIAILCISVIMIVLASNTFAVRAANDGEIVMAYCQNDNLYAYVNLPSGSDAAGLNVQARIGSEKYDIREPKLQKISESSVPVSYLFMIDISTSMPKYKENVDKFVEGVVETVQGNASYIVATFGEKFEQIGEITDNTQELLETIKAIQYNANQTSLYTGIMDAINFFNKKERANGEIYHLVIISDGIEYDKNGPTQSEVKEHISGSTPIMIHTFGLCTRKKDEAEIKASDEALKVLGAFSRATSGIHTTFGRDEQTEVQLAGQITDYINNLYQAQFNLLMHTKKDSSFNLGLLFSPIGDSGEMFRLDKANVPYLQQEGSADASSGNANEISEDNGVNKDIDDEAGNEPGNSIDDEKGKESGNSTDDEKGKESGNSTEDEKEKESGNSTDDVATNTSGEGAGSKSPKLFGINIVLLGVALAAIILLLVATIYFLTRKKAIPIGDDKHNIFMKLEVISGKCITKKKELYLADEFIVGRNKKSHIAFKDKDVSNKNSRVFVRDNIIYVEDMNSTNGTAIGGMKIHAPNRLRSGDEISIGTVKFKLKF